MTDTDIITMAKLRFEQINRNVDFQHGDFDIYLPKNIIAKAIVHAGMIKYIEIPDAELGCRRKIPVNN